MTKEDFLTHVPKHPKCLVCNNCNIHKSQHRKSKHTAEDKILVHDEPKEFGDSVAVDHKMSSNKAFTSFDKACVCLVIQDHATYFLGLYLADSEDVNRTIQAFYVFVGPNDKGKLVYSDDSNETAAACKPLHLRHASIGFKRSTPKTAAVLAVALQKSSKSNHV